MVVTPDAALPDLDYEALSFAQTLSVVLEALRETPGVVADPSPAPPYSARDCAEAALRFAAGGYRDPAVILDARLAVNEFGVARRLHLLTWTVRQAVPAVMTPELLAEVTAGLSPDHARAVAGPRPLPWLIAYDRVQRLARDPVTRATLRDLYKTFFRANAASLRDAAVWKAVLTPFVTKPVAKKT